MPKLRVLSGREVLKILSGFGFQEFSQRGSHIEIRRVIAGQTHDEIDRGTLQAIYRQAGRFVPELDLRAEFYTD
jgi:predicted RNA binding protein YcfA (HicA-like mRNA interferase family)